MVTKINFLLTIPIPCQEIRFWELMKWSLKRKWFDLLSNSLNFPFKEIYRDQFGELVCGFWGLKGFFIDTRWNLFEERGPSSISRPKSVAALNQYFCLKKKKTGCLRNCTKDLTLCISPLLCHWKAKVKLNYYLSAGPFISLKIISVIVFTWKNDTAWHGYIRLFVNCIKKINQRRGFCQIFKCWIIKS